MVVGHLHHSEMRTPSLAGEDADSWNKAPKDADVQLSLRLPKSKLGILLEDKSYADQ